MKIEDIDVLPGCVSSIDDPNHIGRVKATVPTLFDSSLMDADGMPWIYPAGICGYQQFSTLKEGSMIWVITDKKTHNEFWYVPMYQQNDISKSIIGSDDNYEDCDILMARQVGTNKVCIYNNSTDGIVIQINDDKKININEDNGITLSFANEGEGTEINLSSDKITIGNPDKDKDDPAVKYNELESFVYALKDDFSELYSVCLNGGIYTMHLTAPISKIVNDLKKITTTKCDTTFVN